MNAKWNELFQKGKIKQPQTQLIDNQYYPIQITKNTKLIMDKNNEPMIVLKGTIIEPDNLTFITSFIRLGFNEDNKENQNHIDTIITISEAINESFDNIFEQYKTSTEILQAITPKLIGKKIQAKIKVDPNNTYKGTQQYTFKPYTIQKINTDTTNSDNLDLDKKPELNTEELKKKFSFE